MQIDPVALPLDPTDVALAVVLAAGLEGEQLGVPREGLKGCQRLSHSHVVAVCVAVHQPSPDRIQAVWLDSARDLSCTDSTQAYCMDGEHSLRIWRLGP